MSKDILSLDLYERKSKFIKEPFKSPLCVVRPHVIGGKSHIFIGGGMNSENTPNLKAFFISIED